MFVAESGASYCSVQSENNSILSRVAQLTWNQKSQRWDFINDLTKTYTFIKHFTFILTFQVFILKEEDLIN